MKRRKESKICEHGKQRLSCYECNGLRICEHGHYNTACWICDPLRYAQKILQVTTGSAKKQGYTPPNISAEEIVTLIQTSKRCALCHSGKDLDWDYYRPPALHHNHETGEVIGFVHPTCNQIEGSGKTEQAYAFREFTYVDPAVSDVIIDGKWANGVLRGQPAPKK